MSEKIFSNNYNISDDSDNKNNTDDHGLQNQKKNVSLLFLGQTGVGKTTVVYAIRDFLEKKSFEQILTTEQEEELEEEDVKTAEGETVKGETREGGTRREAGASRTSEPYAIVTKAHTHFNAMLIDTPGIGDTNGKKQDEINWDHVANFIESSEFNAIVFVVDKGNTRATQDLCYVINELKKNFQTLFQEHLIIMITRCHGNPSKQTYGTLEKLGLPTKNIICVDNEPYDEQVSINTPSIEENECRRNQFEKNHQKFHQLLEMASKFKLFQGSLLTKYRERRVECVNELRQCEDNLELLEEEIKELNKAKEKLANLPDKDVPIFLGSLKKKERTWIKVSDKVQLYCLECKISCHDPCQEVTDIKANVHQCAQFELNTEQIKQMQALKMAKELVPPIETIGIAVTGGFAGLGVATTFAALTAIAISGPIVGTAIGLGIVIGAAIGEKKARNRRKKYLQRAGQVYYCHSTSCNHPAYAHVFLNQFPQDLINNRSLKTRRDLEETLESLKKKKEESTDLQQYLQKQLEIEQNPFTSSVFSNEKTSRSQPKTG